MKKFKRQLIGTSLAVLACGITFACTVTALQAEPPKELPEELKPARIISSVAYTPEEPELVEPEVVETAKAVEAIQTTDLGRFKLTAYCTCEKCCGQWADGITYSGTQATAGRTIAVDPDVIPLGSTVYIDGTEYIAEDIGGAIKDNRIDVLLPTHQEALTFGVKYANVQIKK